MGLPTGFLIGLALGAIVGFVVVWGMPSASKGKRSTRESQAEKLFNLAIQQEDPKRKLELLRKVFDKYPHTEWADKALEEVMKMRK